MWRLVFFTDSNYSVVTCMMTNEQTCVQITQTLLFYFCCKNFPNSSADLIHTWIRDLICWSWSFHPRWLHVLHNIYLLELEGFKGSALHRCFYDDASLMNSWEHVCVQRFFSWCSGVSDLWFWEQKEVPLDVRRISPFRILFLHQINSVVSLSLTSRRWTLKSQKFFRRLWS